MGRESVDSRAVGCVGRFEPIAEAHVVEGRQRTPAQPSRRITARARVPPHRLLLRAGLRLRLRLRSLRGERERERGERERERGERERLRLRPRLRERDLEARGVGAGGRSGWEPRPCTGSWQAHAARSEAACQRGKKDGCKAVVVPSPAPGPRTAARAAAAVTCRAHTACAVKRMRRHQESCERGSSWAEQPEHNQAAHRHRHRSHRHRRSRHRHRHSRRRSHRRLQCRNTRVVHEPHIAAGSLSSAATNTHPRLAGALRSGAAAASCGSSHARCTSPASAGITQRCASPPRPPSRSSTRRT